MPLENIDQNNFEVNQQLPANNRSIKYIILLLCLVSFLFGIVVLAAVWYFTNQTSLKSQKPSNIDNPSIQSNLNNSSVKSEQVIPTVYTLNHPINLQKLLKDSCVKKNLPNYNNTGTYEAYTIDINLLPIVFSSEILAKYNTAGNGLCSFAGSLPEERDKREYGLVYLENRLSPSENVELYVMTPESKIYGMSPVVSSNYDSSTFVNDYTKEGGIVLSHNNTTHYLTILNPGPYGISDLGIWLSIQSYKKLNGYIFARSQLKIIKFNDDLYKLFKPYESKFEAAGIQGDVPTRTYNDNIKKVFFNKYFSSIDSVSAEYRTYLDLAETELNGIYLK